MLRSLCAFLLLASGAVAQPRLAFDAERHDFGTFTEGEVVTHVFHFTNAGDAALEIADVEVACGCTTPAWTREPVAPGARGSVTVAYDSEARPGPFEKLVTVAASGADPVSLRIVGDVTSVFVARGVALGGLTFASDRIDVEPSALGTPIQEAVRFQHTGDRPVRILSVRAPEGIEVSFPSRPIFPGDVRAIMVTVEDPTAIARGGELDAEIVVVTDQADAAEMLIRLVSGPDEASGRG